MQALPTNCKHITLQDVTIGAQRSNPETTSFAIYHNDFLSILGPHPSITLAWEHPTDPLAHEAGIYIPSTDSIFTTSSRFIPSSSSDDSSSSAAETIQISKFTRDPSTSTWTRSDVNPTPPTVMANGGINYGPGCLFCTQGDAKGNRSSLVLMSSAPPYQTTPFLDSFHGREFNSLNDVVVHSDGSIWFTDPIYGFEQGFKRSPQLPNQVYRFDPGTGDVRAVADGFGRPNGICFSPDEKTVYVTDTDWVHGDGTMVDTRVSSIYAFTLTHHNNSPFLTSRRLFAFSPAGIPDGIKCDTAGNVYSGCGDGLSVWNAGGTLLGKVLVPGGVANFCFGRKGEVFLLNETRFWVVGWSGQVEGQLLKGMGIEV